MYPIMLNLIDKQIVIIGGGKIAYRKTLGILKAKGKVTVIAPEILPEFNELTGVTLIKEAYLTEHIQSAQLVFACTNSKQVNQQIVNDAAAWQWVNDCSQKENSDFYNMGTIEKDDYLIALSAYGKNPKAIKQLKAALIHKLI